MIILSKSGSANDGCDKNKDKITPNENTMRIIKKGTVDKIHTCKSRNWFKFELGLNVRCTFKYVRKYLHT